MFLFLQGPPSSPILNGLTDRNNTTMVPIGTSALPTLPAALPAALPALPAPILNPTQPAQIVQPQVQTQVQTQNQPQVNNTSETPPGVSMNLSEQYFMYIFILLYFLFSKYDI